LSELGRIPFALDCFTSVFKYWYRLDSSTNFLLKRVHTLKINSYTHRVVTLGALLIVETQTLLLNINSSLTG
jgi:hypothetical protein